VPTAPSTAASGDVSSRTLCCLVHIAGGEAGGREEGQGQPTIARCNLLCGLPLGADWCMGVSGGACPSVRDCRMAGGCLGGVLVRSTSAALLHSTLITGSGGDGVVALCRAAPRLVNTTVSGHAGCGVMCLGRAHTFLCVVSLYIYCFFYR
jgi:hypothetical protein